MDHPYKINKIENHFKYFRSEEHFDIFCIYTLPYITNWNMTSFEKNELMNEIHKVREFKKQNELKRMLKQQLPSFISRQLSLIRDI